MSPLMILKTGEQRWRFYTVPGNPADGFESETMRMAAENMGWRMVAAKWRRKQPGIQWLMTLISDSIFNGSGVLRHGTLRLEVKVLAITYLFLQ